MPVMVSRTATQAAWHAWRNVQPGDIFFTTGGGVVGQLIRHGTSSPYGHCGVVHSTGKDADDNNLLYTAEAFPAMPPWSPGLRFRTRKLDTVAAMVRVWRTEAERTRLLQKSAAMVELELPYAWSEIAIIAAAVVLPHKLIPTSDISGAVICSNHVSACVQAARPDDYDKYFRYKPHQEWPGGAHYDMQAMLWDDMYGSADGTAGS